MSDLTPILAGHVYIERQSISGPARCSCGWEHTPPLGHSVTNAWADHVDAR